MGAELRIEYFDPIVFVRWFAVPRNETAAELVEQLSLLSKKHSKKMHCVILVGESLPIPNADGRAALKQLLSASQPYVHCVRLVFEGNSVKSTMQRTIVDAAQMLARLTGGTTYVHSTGAEAVKAVMTEMRLSADFLTLKAKGAGLFA